MKGQDQSKAGATRHLYTFNCLCVFFSGSLLDETQSCEFRLFFRSSCYLHVLVVVLIIIVILDVAILSVSGYMLNRTLKEVSPQLSSSSIDSEEDTIFTKTFAKCPAFVWLLAAILGFPFVTAVYLFIYCYYKAKIDSKFSFQFLQLAVVKFCIWAGLQ